jgi:hypothetical protein
LAFIPVNYDEHWGLVVVDMRFRIKRIMFLDPLIDYFQVNKIFDITKEYLRVQHRRFSPDPSSTSLDVRSFDDKRKWVFLDTPTLLKKGMKLPLQGPSLDCGVFIAMYADCLSQGKPMQFAQRDMFRLRYRIVTTITSAEQLSPFEVPIIPSSPGIRPVTRLCPMRENVAQAMQDSLGAAPSPSYLCWRKIRRRLHGVAVSDMDAYIRCFHTACRSRNYRKVKYRSVVRWYIDCQPPRI